MVGRGSSKLSAAAGRRDTSRLISAAALSAALGSSVAQLSSTPSSETTGTRHVSPAAMQLRIRAMVEAPPGASSTRQSSSRSVPAPPSVEGQVSKLTVNARSCVAVCATAASRAMSAESAGRTVRGAPGCEE